MNAIEAPLRADDRRRVVLPAPATPVFGEGAAGLMDYPPGHVEGFPDTFKMNFRAIYGAIIGNQAVPPLFATAEDGHQEVAVCEAILQSHRARTWTRVQSGRG